MFIEKMPVKAFSMDIHGAEWAEAGDNRGKDGSVARVASYNGRNSSCITKVVAIAWERKPWVSYVLDRHCWHRAGGIGAAGADA